MERITYKTIQKWIADCNYNLCGMPLKVTSFNGYTHIYVGSHHIVGSTARETWELYEQFRSGFYTAIEQFNCNC